MIKLFIRMKLLFMEYNYKHPSSNAFLVFWKNLKKLYHRITNFKIVIKVIRLHKKEFSYLTVDLREICSTTLKIKDKNKRYYFRSTKNWCYSFR